MIVILINYWFQVFFNIKYQYDGTIDRYKVWLFAKGYTQTYRLVFFETLSLIACLATIYLVIYVVLYYAWNLNQLGVKNIFLYEDWLKLWICNNLFVSNNRMSVVRYVFGRKLYPDSNRIQEHSFINLWRLRLNFVCFHIIPC